MKREGFNPVYGHGAVSPTEPVTVGSRYCRVTEGQAIEPHQTGIKHGSNTDRSSACATCSYGQVRFKRVCNISGLEEPWDYARAQEIVKIAGRTRFRRRTFNKKKKKLAVNPILFHSAWHHFGRWARNLRDGYARRRRKRLSGVIERVAEAGSGRAAKACREGFRRTPMRPSGLVNVCNSW